MLYTYRRDDTRAVWSDQSGLVLCLEDVCDSDHVVLWDTLSDTHDEWDLCSNRLFDTGSGDWRRNKDGGCVGTSLLHGVAYAGKNGLAEMGSASFLGICAADNICAVLYGLLCVERSLFTSETLVYDFGRVTDPQVHVCGSVAAG